MSMTYSELEQLLSDARDEIEQLKEEKANFTQDLQDIYMNTLLS